MNNYEKKIRKRINLFAVVTMVAACFCVFDQFFASESLRQNDIYAFQLGILCAIAILCSLNIVKYKKILKDSNKLRFEYNKENDERIKSIRSKAGFPIILYTSIAMIFAGIIGGYFNIIIFNTLIITALCQIVISAILKLVYMKKI